MRRRHLRSSPEHGRSGRPTPLPHLLAPVTVAVILLTLACASTPRYRPLREGQRLLEAGAPEDAIPHLEAALRSGRHPLRAREALNRARREAVSARIERARKFLATGALQQALEEVRQALRVNSLDPVARDLELQIETRMRLQGLRGEAAAARKENAAEAAELDRRLRDLDPFHPEFGLQDEETRLPEATTAYAEPITVNFEDLEVRDALRALAELSGMNIIVEENVPERYLSVSLSDLPFNRVLDHILTMAGLFKIPLDSRTILVVNDTPADRERFERTGLRAFYLRHADAAQVGELLRPLLPDVPIVVDEPLNLLLVRGRPAELELARRTIEAMDIRAAEVVIELELLEVNRSRLRDIGVELSRYDISASLQGPLRRQGDRAGLTLADLDHLGRGDLLIQIPSAALRLLKEDSHTRTLAAPTLRILNRKNARLHIGEKVPIKTTTSIFRDAREELTTYEYRDIGIVLDISPRILGSSEVDLELKLEVSSVVREGSEGQPTIGTRELSTVLRLRDGETEMLAGMIRDDERNGRLSLPLLGEIPLIGRLFGRRSTSSQATDILLSITPHILGNPASPPRSHYDLWSTTAAQLPTAHGTRPPRAAAPPTRQSAPGGAIPTSEGGDEETPALPGAPGGRRAPDAGAGSDAESSGAMAVVRIDPATVILRPEETIQLDVLVEDATNVGAVPFYLLFDPAVVHVLSASEGSFLNADGSPTSFMTSIDNTNGRLIVGLSRLGGDEGASGSGTLITLEIQATGAGETALAFSRAAMRDPSAAPLPARFLNGTVLVR
jgi:general secretion pathway protein D